MQTNSLASCGHVKVAITLNFWIMSILICLVYSAGSVDGLVEASRQSRVCAGAANEVMCAVFRVLMEVR